MARKSKWKDFNQRGALPAGTLRQSFANPGELVVTELHYHRNGVCGTGYYAGRAQWTPEDETFRVMFAAFLNDDGECHCEGHIAIMGDNDVETSFRFEDFDHNLRKFIKSRAGQFMAFPHTLVRA